ncbi:MAG: hypothetical protein VSS75_018350 [Candidatus Parabeggiatoa sp.]|nr:hypothetical protein [Candidatus Parabeggiatoa sp.]
MPRVFYTSRLKNTKCRDAMPRVSYTLRLLGFASLMPSVSYA